MGGGPSKPVEEGPVLIRVKAAPKDLVPGDYFDIEGLFGATWKGLQVPEGGTPVAAGEAFQACCDRTKVKIEVQAREDAQEGEDFLASKHPFEWTVENAPKGGVKKGQMITINYDEILSKKHYMFEANENTMTPPGKEFTGVEPYIAQICATMSQQIYYADRKKQFKTNTTFGNHEAIIKILDTHGASNPAIPAFAIGIVESQNKNTMICVWRGTKVDGTTTNAVFDAISDFAIGPVMCHPLGTAASGIRMQSAMQAFASMELAVHGETMRSLIAEYQITDIVFTGHSLGGGIAFCAHPILQAQMDGLNDSSSGKKWMNLGDNITVRTLAFSGPPAVIGSGLVLDPDGKTIINQEAVDLLAKVGKTTVNMMYGVDIVPRGYSHVDYIGEVVNNVLLEDAPELVNAKAQEATPSRFGFGAGSVVNRAIGWEGIVQQIMKLGKEDAIAAIRNFRHLGTILYYKDMEATAGNPLVLTDIGPIDGKETAPDHFNHYTFESHKPFPKGKNNIDMLMAAHSNPKDLMASYTTMGHSAIIEEDAATNGGQPEPDSKKQKS